MTLVLAGHAVLRGTLDRVVPLDVAPSGGGLSLLPVILLVLLAVVILFAVIMLTRLRRKGRR